MLMRVHIYPNRTLICISPSLSHVVSQVHCRRDKLWLPRDVVNRLKPMNDISQKKDYRFTDSYANVIISCWFIEM